MENLDPLIQDFISFLDKSPTSWHAVNEIKIRLQASGFEELHEDRLWDLKPEKSYFLVRDGSSLLAFTLPKKTPKELKIAAGHTDSPALKLKPNAEFIKEHMVMLGVEIYGAPLLTSWLNRDLKIVGRVLLQNKTGKIIEKLVNFENHPVIIPQLAIHLDRTVNETGLLLNKQEHLSAIASIDLSKKHSYLETLIQDEFASHTILETDLFLVPLEKAQFLGFKQEMIASYRLDNLESVHAAVSGFLNAKSKEENLLKMIAFWDHEEIGSQTTQGAGSPLFLNSLERIILALGLHREDYFNLMANSHCISMDMAHALHPNHMDKHDPRHAPLLGRGIVLKYNAHQRYATDAKTAAHIIQLCQKHNLPFQKFVSRNDMPCGSTIGPIHASLTGIPTVDIGCPQFSMHSIREVMATQDHLTMCALIKAYFS